jgi:hypothetical protein
MNVEKTTDGFLDQIREKLLTDMGKKLEGNPQVKTEETKIEQKKELTKDSKERGSFIMQKLKRMP